jgi:hypothetical protein
MMFPESKAYVVVWRVVAVLSRRPLTVASQRHGCVEQVVVRPKAQIRAERSHPALYIDDGGLV